VKIKTYRFKNVTAAARQLAQRPTPSNRHMEHLERAKCIRVMLEDLHLLASRDGCIAAAWALEFALASAATIRDGKYPEASK
jgi:hypothetical protein